MATYMDAINGKHDSGENSITESNYQDSYNQRAIEYLKPFAERLLESTKGCRIDMHEPDEQNLSAEVVGTVLDNAFGESIELSKLGDAQEIVVILERDGREEAHCDHFNLASLIALARMGAKSITHKENKNETNH